MALDKIWAMTNRPLITISYDAARDALGALRIEADRMSRHAQADARMVAIGVDSGRRMHAYRAENKRLNGLADEIERALCAADDPSIVQCTCGATSPAMYVDRHGVELGFAHTDGCATLAGIHENDA